MPDDTTDLQPPDLDKAESASDIFDQLTAFETSGGDVESLNLEPEEANADEGVEAPAEEQADGPPAPEQAEPEQPAAESTDTPDEATPPEPATPAEAPVEVAEPETPEPDASVDRAPKPDFDPNKLEGEARKVYEFAETQRRFQQSRNAKKIHSIIGDRRPDDVREILSRWQTLDGAPELAGARALIRGDSQYAAFAQALLDPNHPSHETAVARVNAEQRQAEVAPDPDVTERLTRAVLTEDGDIDQTKLYRLVANAREQALAEARQAAPTSPTPEASPLEAWAAQNKVPTDDLSYYVEKWEADGRPNYDSISGWHSYLGRTREVLEADRKADEETARLRELERHVNEGQPKPASSGPGSSITSKIDLGKYDTAVDIAEALIKGEIPEDHPLVARAQEED